MKGSPLNPGAFSLDGSPKKQISLFQGTKSWPGTSVRTTKLRNSLWLLLPSASMGHCLPAQTKWTEDGFSPAGGQRSNGCSDFQRIPLLQRLLLFLCWRSQLVALKQDEQKVPFLH